MSVTSCATTKEWGSLAVHDAKSLVTSVRDADAETWKKAGLVTAGVLASATLDGVAESAIGANDSDELDDVTDTVEPFGGGHSEKVLAGFLVVGLVNKDKKMMSVAFDGFVASLVASKLITPALKSIVGRTRPSETDETFEFGGGDSFPSGHATQAFTIASV